MLLITFLYLIKFCIASLGELRAAAATARVHPEEGGSAEEAKAALQADEKVFDIHFVAQSGYVSAN